MWAGARSWSSRQKGWPASQCNSSLLVSARQLQALVRRLVTDRGLGTEGVPCLRLVEQAPEGVPLREEGGKLRRTRQTGLRPPDELCSETREMQPSVLSKVISYRGSEQLPNGALVVPLESVQARETRIVGEANILPPQCLLETPPHRLGHHEELG